MIEEVVSRIEDWRGRDVVITAAFRRADQHQLQGGGGRQPHFVRVPGASTELLAIDRDNEHHNARAASQAGIAPRVLHHVPEYNSMVIEYLNGETMSKDSLNQSGMPRRMAEAIKKLNRRSPLPSGLQHVPPHGILSQPVP
jgi:hypothetical protein